MTHRRRYQDLISLMLLSPDLCFWGAIAAMITIEFSKDTVKTAALVYEAKSHMPKIVLNPDFIDKLTDEQLCFLVIHELKHFVYMHPWQAKSLNPSLFNIEADRYINSEIVQDSILDKNSRTKHVEAIANIFYLPDNETIAKTSVLELYYKALQELSTPDGGLNDKAKSLLDKIMAAQATAAETGEVYGQLDDHGSWEDIANGVSQEEAQDLIEKMATEAGKIAGSIPGDIQQMINGFKQPKILWRKHIRSWVGRVISSLKKLNWGRVHKLLPDDLPGMKREYQSCVGFIMDVSGSISSEEFKEFNSEAIYISKRMPCKYIQVDTTIKEPPKKYDGQRIKQSGITRTGYGGTDMNPGIEAMMKDPDVHFVILFTDGHIPQLKEHLICKPLLIVITSNGKMLESSRRYRLLRIPK